MRWAAALLLALATPALAAERSFTIAGEAFSEADILDARAQPDIAGGATILVTFSESGGAKLAAVTRRRVEQEAPFVLDGRTLTSPVVREPIEGGIITIAGQFTLAEAEALARAISGKDPLPESLDE